MERVKCNLVLAAKPIIYIFFGKAGAGKTYIGKLYAKEFNALYYEGDLAIPPSMNFAISHNEPITRDIIDEFLLRSLKQKIDDLVVSLKDGQLLIVSQAFYLRQFREIYRRIYRDKIQFVL